MFTDKHCYASQHSYLICRLDGTTSHELAWPLHQTLPSDRTWHGHSIRHCLLIAPGMATPSDTAFRSHLCRVVFRYWHGHSIRHCLPIAPLSCSLQVLTDLMLLGGGGGGGVSLLWKQFDTNLPIVTKLILNMYQ